jgi:rubrerythrin
MFGFIRESQTRSRYEIYADVARKEDFMIISRTFEEFAMQKKECAILFFKKLKELRKNDPVEEISLEVKSNTTFGTSLENLESAIKEEDEIWQEKYPNFANTAKIEGYIEIANIFKEFAQNERNSSQRLKMFLNLIFSDSFIDKNKITYWKCLACGYEIALDELPNDFNCPSCGHFKSYFQRKSLSLKKTSDKKPFSGWVCMECGYEVALEELPDNWKCGSCGHPKAYFKRETLKPLKYKIESVPREKARWLCLECGNEEEIELPAGWKCSKCGFPSD